MYDYKPTLVRELKQATNLPVYAENFLTANTEMPCISYYLCSDSTYKQGDTLGYSEIYYYIKVWSTKVSDLASYATIIDNKMRQLGFKRVGATEL